MQLSEAAKEFLDSNPSHMATVYGYRFYEHPVYGDEAPLCVVTPSGRLLPPWEADFWDVPSWEEMVDAVINDPTLH